MKWRMAILAGSLLTVMPWSVASAAEMDAKQIQIVAKVFYFLEKKPPAQSLVVVMPGAANLDAVKAALGGMTVVEGTLANVGGAFAVFVNSTADAKAASAANASIMTISGDVSCVDQGFCIIAIETQPRVSIFTSRAAAAKAGIGFEANFKMLVTEH